MTSPDNVLETLENLADVGVLLVVRDLMRDIHNGTYGDGDQLPGATELAASHSIPQWRAAQCIHLLHRAGYVDLRAGRGVYVRHREPQSLDDLIAVLDTAIDNIDSLIPPTPRHESAPAQPR